MAINYKLKERGTGVTLYPETSTEQVFGPDGRSLKTVLPEMQERIEGKQDEFSTSEGLAMEDGLLSLTERAKQMLFDDMWKAAAGDYGTVNHTHVEDGVKKPYYLNGLWFTYDEAVSIHTLCVGKTINVAGAQATGIFSSRLRTRTVYPIYYATGDILLDMGGMCHSNSKIEVIRFVANANNNSISSIRYAFYFCKNLKHIYGPLYVSRITDYTAVFTRCEALETVNLYYLKSNISFADSPLLSLESLNVMVTNAAITEKGFIITVHPDVYAKLADPENEEWHKVLTDALEKNITFATV